MVRNKKHLNHNLLPYLRLMGDQVLFNHPAYVCLYFGEPDEETAENYIINKKVQTNYAKHNDARRVGAFHASLTFIDPSHRITCLLKDKDKMTDDNEYWKAVKYTLESQPHGYSDTGPWSKIWMRTPNPTLQTEWFESLADEITIYQAGNRYEFGTAAMRWTMDKSKAENDVAKFSSSCELKKGAVKKNKILYVHYSPDGMYIYVDSRDVIIDEQ